jgi:hypothetical protein
MNGGVEDFLFLSVKLKKKIIPLAAMWVKGHR